VEGQDGGPTHLERPNDRVDNWGGNCGRGREGEVHLDNLKSTGNPGNIGRNTAWEGSGCSQRI